MRRPHFGYLEHEVQPSCLVRAEVLRDHLHQCTPTEIWPVVAPFLNVLRDSGRYLYSTIVLPGFCGGRIRVGGLRVFGLNPPIVAVYWPYLRDKKTGRRATV